MLIGRFHRPRVERRAFLFMDMRGSTTLAESLGHATYSRMVQRCFSDLTGLVLEHGAQIYQYLGDGVILSWGLAEAQAAAQPARLFYGYSRLLEQCQAEYRSLYGAAPSFRGGADLGTVTATEVGDIKREIAYHGDVLNTAARLQELGKTYGSRMLVSERLHEVMLEAGGFSLELKGEVVLRGKAEPTRVYAVEPSQ